MHSTETKFKVTHRDRPSLKVPCEMALNDVDIHHIPSGYRKSLKMQLRMRPGFHRRSKGGSDVTQQKSRQYQHTAQINMNGIINQHKLSILHEHKNMSQSPIRIPEQFETTADRMLSLRRRLAPVRRQRQQKRFIASVEKNRAGAVQRATFLNIEKVELVKMCSNSQRRDDSQRTIETADQRYVFSPLPLPYKKQSAQVNLNDMMVEFRKTMKEATTHRWNSTRPRIKPFVIPFQRYHYKDFVWKVAFSNGLLLTTLPQDAKVKVYVGKGNNSQLVRSLIKRRHWWSFTDKWQEANLVWTQLKINSYFGLQSTDSSQYKTWKCQISKDVIQRNENNLNIMNENDVQVWDSYWKEYRSIEGKLSEDMSKRTAHFKRMNLGLKKVNTKTLRMQNHMSQNFIIGNKKALLYTMRQYYESCGMDVFDYLPLSFHVTKGMEDPEYLRFLSHFYERRKKSKKQGTRNAWIVKPGELTNRGNGIIVCLTLDQIKNILKRGGKHFDGTPKTFILQEYIERPFLYQRRKFDIRHFILVTSINGRFKGYWFKRGYIRTTSSEYTLNHGQSHVHLTNDAVQKYMPDYGRFQKGNKVSYKDFQAYLTRQYQGRFDFFEEIYPKMKNMANDIIRASANKLDPRNREHNFQLFGLDFMIDQHFQPWLIECNSNPCLEISCPLQKSMIPALIENTLKICVDSMVGPPADFQQKRPRFMDNVLANNQFEMIYDSVLETPPVQSPNCEGLNIAELDNEEDQQFEDDGEALQD